VHVKDIVPVAEEKVKAELPEYLKSLRQRRQYEAFNQWFRKQVDMARIDLPGDQPRATAQ
jgi:hypothetical protein